MSRPIQVKPADSESRTGNQFIGSFSLISYNERIVYLLVIPFSHTHTHIHAHNTLVETRRK